MFRITTLLFVLLISGCTYWPSGTYFRQGIAQYRGDGTIRDVSQREVFFGSRGYVIESDKFDLGAAFDKQFRLANLPTIANSSAEICLAVEDEEISRLGIASELTVSLTDSSGVTVSGLSTNIGTMVWSSPVHGYSGHWVYDQKGSFFVPLPGETYSLSVHYSPDSKLRGKHGCIYLYSGCGGS